MEQQPTPIIKLLGLMIFLGSIVYLLGAIFQILILNRNKNSWRKILTILLLTRVLTISLSLVIWHLWKFPFDIIFLFLFLPAVVPELILSPLMLKMFGNDVWRKKPVHNNISYEKQ